MRRLPGVVLLLILLQVAQLGLFELVGALSGPIDKRGTAFLAVLLVGVAYRSRIAWTLLTLVNGIPLLALLPTIGGGLIWSHAAVMILTAVALLAVLLSGAMRDHVFGRRYPAAVAP